MYYNKFIKNIYSQNGEDGVLSKIIEEMQFKIDEMWVVDVGAYDGISYSNFYNLIQKGANAVLIEPSLVGGVCEEKYLKLKLLPKKYPKVKTLNHFTKINDQIKSNIGYMYCKHINEELCNIRNFDPPQKTLDESLDEVCLGNEYDILNIDIDSYDHEVWNEHTRSPKIVIMEINSGLLPIKSNKSDGVSFADSLEYGEKMGYSCVCHTGNMIYIRNDLLSKLSIPNHMINSVQLFNRGWLR